MDPASMVHALEIIRDLLQPNGVLIDLRPKGIPAELSLQKAGSSVLIGRIEETDDFVEYRQAAWAMEQAIDKGWFRLRSSAEYDFTIHAGSLEELKDYLAREWTDAVIRPELETKAKAVEIERVTLRDFIHLGVLDRA
jgi:hypothetical protein